MFEVVFDSQRVRHLGWAIFHLAFGGLLVYSLGAVAKGIGIFFLFLGVLRAVKFLRRVGGPEASITIGAEKISLPKKLTTRAEDRQTFGTGDIANVFYLRRSLPWFRISPILVVETSAGGDGADVYRYPRDWFAADADQRRVADAISRQLGRQVPDGLISDDEEADGEKHDTAASRRNRAVAFFITSGAFVMVANLGFTISLRSWVLPTAGLYVLSAMAFVAGVYHLLIAPPKDDGATKTSKRPSA